MLRTASLRQHKPVSYPRLPRAVTRSSGIAPRAFLPLRPNPHQVMGVPLHTPRHPSNSSPSASGLSGPRGPGWAVSEHAAPAAYPRSMPQAIGRLSRESHPYAVPPASSPASSTSPAAGNSGTSPSGPGSTPPATESKEDRNKRLVAEAARCMATRAEARFWPLDEALKAEHPPLWIAAERWQLTPEGGTSGAPSGGPSGAQSGPQSGAASAEGETLVFTHACGLGKEHWRPVLRALGPLLRSPTGGEFGTGRPLPSPSPPSVREAWLLEDSNHGTSVTLNAGALGPALVWDDSAREVINFVENVLPSVAPKESPFVLPFAAPTPGAETPGAEAGMEAGKGGVKQVIGIGHSYGANALVQAARARPELFKALLLIEPMTLPSLVNGEGAPLTLGALKRRDTWPSREAARAARKNGMFSRWSEDQFEEWISSLVEHPEGGVQLRTPRWAEAQTFSEPDAPMRGWDKLADLPMPVGFVMAEDETWMTGPEVARELVWRPPRARNERIMGTSHLVIQEKPEETAGAVDRFLRTVRGWDSASRQD